MILDVFLCRDRSGEINRCIKLACLFFWTIIHRSRGALGVREIKVVVNFRLGNVKSHVWLPQSCVHKASAVHFSRSIFISGISKRGSWRLPLTMIPGCSRRSPDKPVKLRSQFLFFFIVLTIGESKLFLSSLLPRLNAPEHVHHVLLVLKHLGEHLAVQTRLREVIWHLAVQGHYVPVQFIQTPVVLVDNGEDFERPELLLQVGPHVTYLLLRIGEQSPLHIPVDGLR
jgi:hypothetical protein